MFKKIFTELTSSSSHIMEKHQQSMAYLVWVFNLYQLIAINVNAIVTVTMRLAEPMDSEASGFGQFNSVFNYSRILFIIHTTWPDWSYMVFHLQWLFFKL